MLGQILEHGREVLVLRVDESFADLVVETNLEPRCLVHVALLDRHELLVDGHRQAREKRSRLVDLGKQLLELLLADVPHCPIGARGA